MKKIKKLLTTMTLVLTLAMVLPTILPITNNILTVEAATVKPSKTKLTLNVGQTYTLKIKGTKSKPKFISSKKSVATVGYTGGKVTANKKGTTTITATVGGKKYTCKVTVEENEFTDESFAAYSWVLLESKYSNEKITVNKFYNGKKIDNKDNVIVIEYTLNSNKKYACIRINDGEAPNSPLIPIYKLECDDLPNQYLHLSTYSLRSDLEEDTTIGDSLDILNIKKLYKQYIKEDNFVVIS